MGARVYDPYTGTFTQPDPIQGADANSYGYTAGDPVNETDTTGDISVRAGRCVGAAIACGIALGGGVADKTGHSGSQDHGNEESGEVVEEKKGEAPATGSGGDTGFIGDGAWHDVPGAPPPGAQVRLPAQSSNVGDIGPSAVLALPDAAYQGVGAIYSFLSGSSPRPSPTPASVPYYEWATP
jgi:uncharacterized protein RhaS with RHS repeats